MIDDGGPAFPVDSMTAHAILTALGIKQDESGYIKARAFIARGMTLRDYFAAKALVGLPFELGDETIDMFAKAAYQFADAMLRARES